MNCYTPTSKHLFCDLMILHSMHSNPIRQPPCAHSIIQRQRAFLMNLAAQWVVCTLPLKTNRVLYGEKVAWWWKEWNKCPLLPPFSWSDASKEKFFCPKCQFQCLCECKKNKIHRRKPCKMTVSWVIARRGFLSCYLWELTLSPWIRIYYTWIPAQGELRMPSGKKNERGPSSILVSIIVSSPAPSPAIHQILEPHTWGFWLNVWK